MKLLLFSGSHSRHCFVHKRLLREFDVIGVVCMQRENIVPSPESSWSNHDQELFRRHFKTRAKVEDEVFGRLATDVFDLVPMKLFIEPEELNTEKTRDFVREVRADACVIFGADLILDPVLSELPKWKLNAHLGLSPWYRGSATLFWPFYFLQPQFAGATIHQIIPEADAGDVLHHVVPTLKSGQGLHDVSAQVVVQTQKDLVVLLRRLEREGQLAVKRQTSTGKLFLIRDFAPYHLRVIYDLHKDKIVDAWLRGELGTRKPRIHDGLT